MDYTAKAVPRYTASALPEACRAMIRDPAIMADYQAWKEDRDARESAGRADQPGR